MIDSIADRTGVAIREYDRRIAELQAELTEYKDAECRAVKAHGEALQKVAKLREALDDLLEQCTTEAGDPEDYIKALYRGNEVLKETE